MRAYLTENFQTHYPKHTYFLLFDLIKTAVESPGYPLKESSKTVFLTLPTSVVC